jgi:hypothetical protein
MENLNRKLARVALFGLLACIGIGIPAGPAMAQGTLSVSKAPDDGGRISGVVDDPNGGVDGEPPATVIDCGADCSARFQRATCHPHVPDCNPGWAGIALSAEPSPGWDFDSWSGQCPGRTIPSCRVGGRERGVVTATANFVRLPTATLNDPPAAPLGPGVWKFTATRDGGGRAITRVDFRIGSVSSSDTTEPYEWAPESRQLLADGTVSSDTTSVKVSATVVAASGRTTTVEREYPVDLQAPSIKITGPEGRVPRQDVTFVVEAPGAASVMCELDGMGARACAGSAPQHYRAGEGPHTLHVTATDASGNVATDQRPFVVDTVAPDTTITFGHAEGETTTAQTALFEFESEAGATFECSADGARFGACASPVRLGGLRPGTHSFAVRAIDAAGNIDGTPATRAWIVRVVDRDGDGFAADGDCDDTNANVRPGTYDVADNGIDEDCSGADAVNFDRDGDGYNRPQDCDDADARINPGALDAPGNRVDEDCSGSPAPWPRLQPRVFMSYTFSGARTRVTRLEARDVPPGASVVVRCTGAGCPTRSHRYAAPRNGRLTMTRAFRKRALRAGARIVVSITRPDAVGTWTAITIRAGKGPIRVDRCLAPGASRPSSCR